ncbi:MAG TPA: hypothetical protein VFG67_00185 [Oleiagrimonas sp.]|nr:hypothetical protein [Oleiagrimonas sp.]
MSARRLSRGQVRMVGSRKNEWLRRNVGTFVRQYERKAQRGVEPNDRHYDRKIENELKRMDPFELDILLNGDGGNELPERSLTQASGALVTITIVSWCEGSPLSSGWGEHAFAQFRKELKRSVSLSPAERKELERGVRAKERIVIHNVQPGSVRGLNIILEALGAEVTVKDQDARCD